MGMRNIDITPEIERALGRNADVAISISGGKDSQALISAVTRYLRSINYQGTVYAVHSHLGRAEWAGAREHCEKIAAQAGIPLIVLERAKGDLLDLMEERLAKLEREGRTEVPFWMDSKNRYCTSYMKRDEIDKYLRTSMDVISVEGIRSQESSARACKPTSEERKRICTKGRKAVTWNAIKSWSLEDVWEECGTSKEDLEARRALYRQGRHAGNESLINQALEGWPCAQAYVFGNERFSCVFCFFGSANDLRTGAEHNPSLLQHYVQLEKRSGKTFKMGFSLSSLVK